MVGPLKFRYSTSHAEEVCQEQLAPSAHQRDAAQETPDNFQAARRRSVSGTFRVTARRRFAVQASE
jgi:hypothetical protein